MLFPLLHSTFLLLLALSSASPPPLLTAWRPARASFYSPTDTLAGACGYNDLDESGYGKATAAISPSLFQKGRLCGACFALRCVDDLPNCLPATSIIVTVTNFCPPNFGLSPDSGGVCNPPNDHFILPVEAFDKIALSKSGNIPVHYRRIKCKRDGGIRFAIDGTGFFISVLISNVAGSGDVVGVKIKGSQTGWLPMGRNWGQNWIISADLKSQPLSFEVTSSDGVTVTDYNVAPKTWNFGQTFEGKQFE